ncbi:MAG: hypothetical protein AB7G37_01845 [Solirubrobacteraceae bacterium]
MHSCTSSRRWLLRLLILPLAVLVPATAADAARVTSLQPWKPSNSYRATADIDGRSSPKREPRAKIDHVRKGQWVKIECQVRGQSAYGSTLWSKVGGYYVPDQLLKTYTDGRLPGVGTCKKRRGSSSGSSTAARPAAWGGQYRRFLSRFGVGDLSRRCVPTKAIALRQRAAYRILTGRRGCIPMVTGKPFPGGLAGAQPWLQATALQGYTWCLVNTMTPAAPVGAVIGLVTATRRCTKHAWLWVTWPGDYRVL